MFNYEVKTIKKDDKFEFILNNPHGNFIKESDKKWLVIPSIEYEPVQKDDLFILTVLPDDYKDNKELSSLLNLPPIASIRRKTNYFFIPYNTKILSQNFLMYFIESVSLGLKSYVEIWPKQQYKKWYEVNRENLEKILMYS